MWVIPPHQHAGFVHQMEQVLDVYHRPYDAQRPVVCLDESPRQLLAETRPSVVLPDGSQRVDYEYHRHGVAQLYMLYEPLRGQRQVRVEARHDRFTWVRIVTGLLEAVYPTVERLTLVQDNLSAHKPAAFYEVYPPERAHALLARLEIVYTPAHGSWLNMAEIEFSVLTTHGLPERVADMASLEQQVQAWQQRRNTHAKPANWQFTAADARIKLRRLYPTTTLN